MVLIGCVAVVVDDHMMVMVVVMQSIMLVTLGCLAVLQVQDYATVMPEFLPIQEVFGGILLLLLASRKDGP